MGNTVDLLEDDPDDSNGLTDTGNHTIVQTQDVKQVENVTTCRQTRSKTRLGNTVDLIGEDAADSCADIEQQIQREIKPHTEKPKIGDVGYIFQKYFNEGWFTGTVVEIRPGACK